MRHVVRWLWMLALVGFLQACRASEGNVAGAAPRELRVASYNIKHGEGLDGRVDLERTAAVLARFDADLIALQEVDVGVRRSGGVDQPHALAQQLEQLTSRRYHASFGE
ncbi:MAG: hypothetical protein NTV21_15650, partial [Planctomycetota bacterium]|nr:hypothetical protein [Planctomycetota bacterium]